MNKKEINNIITKRDRHNAILRWMFMGSALYN
ncbi:MAG: PTS fructose transporter subunit IID, partial [Streptococcus mutans]